MSAASRQDTAAPRRYIIDIPMDKNSWVTVHRAPRMDASLENNV